MGISIYKRRKKERMIKLNLNLIYFSPTGATRKSVRAIGRGISEGRDLKHMEFNLTKDRTMRKTEFEKDDIVVVGVPVYAGRIPELVEDVFKGLKSDGAYFLPVVTYGNRDIDDALLELCDIFTENGFKMAGYAEMIGEHSLTSEVGTGRPNKEDLKAAEEYGKIVMERIQNGETFSGEIPGNRPYKERTESVEVWGPVASNRCTFCGICILQCPVDAIDHLNPKKTDYEKCIHCGGCIRRCPQGAKENQGELFEKIKGMLETKFSERKEIRMC